MSTTVPRTPAASPYTAPAPGSRKGPAGDRPPTVAPDARRLTPLAAVGWTAVIASAVYFVATKMHYLLRFDARSFGPFWRYAGWLVPHIGAGILALFLGPFQFRTALRRRFARLHRWMGRAYLAAVAVGATMAVVMLSRTQLAGMAYRAGLWGLTTAWVGATAVAFTSIRRGNIAQHREWMVRSYVLTFAFVAFRVIHRAVIAAGVGTPEDQVAIAAWGCWAIPLLLTEFAMQGRKVLRTPVRPLPPLPE